jgi:putative hydrolase of the HAD superfamily
MFKYLLFDLDNTLYSCNYGLEDNVSSRIREFAAGFLGVSQEEAWQQRTATATQYGTCLAWLMAEKGFTDPEAYLAAAHPEGEADSLPPAPELRAFLLGIPVPKAILTNSPREHADLILNKLGLNGIFTHVFDIRQCGYLGKPRREVFENALRILGVSAADVLFIDDSPFYVEGFIALGGKGILIDENDIHKNSPLPRIRDIKELAGYLSNEQ